MLCDTYDRLNARLQALRFRSNQHGDKWKHAVEEHEKMIDALTRRDGAALSRLLARHLENKLAVVLKQLPASQASPWREGGRP